MRRREYQFFIEKVTYHNTKHFLLHSTNQQKRFVTKFINFVPCFHILSQTILNQLIYFTITATFKILLDQILPLTHVKKNETKFDYNTD